MSATDRPSREPLPESVATLPVPSPEFGAIVDAALQALDLDLTPGMRSAIEAQARLLAAWTAHVNLTAIRDEAGIAREHVADSLAAVPAILDRLANRRDPHRPPSVLDIGSGAGYPGLPVAVAIPAGRGVLLDSIEKKVRFLAVAARAARAAFEDAGEEPPRLEAIRGRAEELVSWSEHADRWDVVTARAIATLQPLVQLALPFVRPGGILVAWKRDAGDGALGAEIEQAEPLLPSLGGSPDVEVVRVPVAGLEDHRLVIVAKVGSTPHRFSGRTGARRRLLP
jgi:16S rRNA (guanine527-N7)-methyltransferase